MDVWIAEVDANYVSPYAQTGRMLAGEKRFLEAKRIPPCILGSKVLCRKQSIFLHLFRSCKINPEKKENRRVTMI